MEEWVGRQWHRFITRAADGRAPQATVRLDGMQRAIGLLFRAGGGGAGVRIAPAGTSRVGGARGLLQRLAGSGTHAVLGQRQSDVLALPPEIGVFDDPALNRALYLWLAALAAHLDPHGDWLASHVAATRAALAAFPGLRARYGQLCAAQLAQRPNPGRLHGRAAEAERAVQQALRGEQPCAPTGITHADVAPLWLWLTLPPGTAAAPARTGAQEQAAAHRPPSASDPRRRAAQAVTDERHAAPLVMFFRAESILSWSEFTRVNRADDDEDDGNALTAANDMDELAIAPDGRSAASRVKFDLDLPSTAQDDLPLGPGERHPEWNHRRQMLLPDHCAVQRYVAREAPPYTPAPALRAVARRMRRRLEALRAAPGRVRGRTEGEEIDLDAWVRHCVDAGQGPRTDAPPVFVQRMRAERSLATLLLADLSLSTDAYATPDARVIDVIRDALQVFGEALAASGDAFEMLGFSSVRRHHVRIQHLKGFDEPWSPAIQARVNAIKPGYYTRMGAALRHATARLATRGERQRLLLILTDGKPNDLDAYEGRHGLEDTRHAVHAARAAGLTPFCVTIDATAHDYLPHLFGSQGYALVHRPQDLVRRLAAAYAGLTRP
ncbi:MAG: VWA domain-containing protein [Acidovorax sp.]|nr:VWA domain-containing protein [Acidovorax sp.]